MLTIEVEDRVVIDEQQIALPGDHALRSKSPLGQRRPPIEIDGNRRLFIHCNHHRGRLTHGCEPLGEFALAAPPGEFALPPPPGEFALPAPPGEFALAAPPGEFALALS